MMARDLKGEHLSPCQPTVSRETLNITHHRSLLMGFDSQGCEIPAQKIRTNTSLPARDLQISHLAMGSMLVLVVCLRPAS